MIVPKLTGAAAVIVDSDGKILLVKHSYGKNNWELPGGKGRTMSPQRKPRKERCLKRWGWRLGLKS